MTNRTALRWAHLLTGAHDAPERSLIGGKAWSLWRMRALGLRVPPAFVIGTDACAAYFAAGGAFPEGLDDDVEAGIAHLESEIERTFGQGSRALLVSVRSGAPVSMPGMMDTVINLGINADVERTLAEETGRSEVAGELHRRFCAMYGAIVLGAVSDLDHRASAAAVREAVREETGSEIPDDPREQLRAAIGAVFESSRSRRARAYRRHYDLPDDVGTAVTVQAMVYGNRDDRSGTGVLFSRNPTTGDPSPFGEFLGRAQGEDVVSGNVTPEPLSALAQHFPEGYDELMAASRLLERDRRDVQDIEFTIQSDVLYLLQSRAAKRTPEAAVRIAVDLAREGVIDCDTAVSRVSPAQARDVLRPRLEDVDGAEVLARGVPACAGVCTGVTVDSPDRAEELVAEAPVLVRQTTSPQDIHGMIAAGGIVTERGGATSHAAVVSRALNKPCVVGCGDGTSERLADRVVTVDGASGVVYAGHVPAVTPSEDESPYCRELSAMAREIAPVSVVPYDGSPRVADAPEVPAEGVLGDDGKFLRAPRFPEGAPYVRGTVFESDAVVAAAIEAGVAGIVAERCLPVLLAAAQHQLQRRPAR